MEQGKGSYPRPDRPRREHVTPDTAEFVPAAWGHAAGEVRRNSGGAYIECACGMRTPAGTEFEAWAAWSEHAVAMIRRERSGDADSIYHERREGGEPS